MGPPPEPTQVGAPGALAESATESKPVAPLDDDAPDVPRCPRCEYLLIGLTADRCPECGTPIDWTQVTYAGRHPGLPLDRARGWARVWAGVTTWFVVLFRPLKFARQVSEAYSVWPPTVFAALAIFVGLAGNWVVALERVDDKPRAFISWCVGIWVHIELQSLVFWLADLRRGGVLRRWSLWRKVSLYTTAFVVLDWVAGPPLMSSYTESWTFPWVLDPESWARLLRTPPVYPSLADTLRGIVFYWWMTVLLVALWVRLRRKWMLLFIAAALPGVTLGSCWVGMWVHEFLG